MKCSQCGSENLDEARVCANCGKSLVPLESSVAGGWASPSATVTGVKLSCLTQPGMELLFRKLVCDIDGERKELKWGEEVWIPLAPSVPHKLTVSFKYLWGGRGPASMELALNPGEVHVYQYHTPVIVSRPGKLSRLH